MNNLVLPVGVGALPAGFCPATEQDRANGFANVMSVAFPTTFTGVTTSATKPTDQTKAWLQLDSLGRPVRFYYFAQGAWLSQHALVPGFTMLWTTALPTLTAFDGGDGNGISPVSGPMWEVVTDLQGKFPLGAGTLTPSSSVIAQGATGGEDQHTLVQAEIPKHTHLYDTYVAPNATNFRNAGSSDPGEFSSDTRLQRQTSSFGGDGTGATTAHNNMPPYFAVNYLRRTNRLFYSVS